MIEILSQNLTLSFESNQYHAVFVTMPAEISFRYMIDWLTKNFQEDKRIKNGFVIKFYYLGRTLQIKEESDLCKENFLKTWTQTEIVGQEEFIHPTVYILDEANNLKSSRNHTPSSLFQGIFDPFSGSPAPSSFDELVMGMEKKYPEDIRYMQRVFDRVFEKKIDPSEENGSDLSDGFFED